MKTNATQTGTITSIVEDRGFGFIRPQGGLPDVFFHVRDLSTDLPFDQTLTERRVSFETTTDPRSGRLRAANVRPA